MKTHGGIMECLKNFKDAKDITISLDNDTEQENTRQTVFNGNGLGFNSKSHSQGFKNGQENKSQIIFNFLKTKYRQDISGKWKVFEIKVDKYVSIDLCRKVMIFSDKNKFEKFIQERSSFKFFTYKQYKICVKTPLNYTAQGLLDMFSNTFNAFSWIKESLGAVSTGLHNFSQSMKDERIGDWIIDFIAIVSELVDPYSYGLKRLLLVLVRIYTLVRRFLQWKNNYFSAQALVFTSFHDVAMAFAALGLPSRIIDMMKNFSFLTGTRITDTSLFMGVFHNVMHLIYEILKWINDQKIVDIQFLLDYIKQLVDYTENYVLIKEITELYTQYMKNQQVIIDIKFRTKVLQLESKCETASFQEYIRNDSNRFFIPLYQSFRDNILRYAKTFDVSSKDEPICIVFSGPPGCGKSSLMNGLVAYLRKHKSVYVHNTPSVDAGKDFYDDYLNQEVFVMDDVGQQGASQWRQIINFVSPVKYPLECAAAEKKNTKFFNSKIILCTTNSFRDLRLTTTDGIADKGALFRRVHLIEMGSDRSCQYFKYDFSGSEPHWVSDFIAPYNTSLTDFLPYFEGNLKQKVVYCATLINRLLRVQENIRDELSFTDNDLEEIHNLVEDGSFYDAQSAHYKDGEVTLILDEVRPMSYWENITNGVGILYEYMQGFFVVVGKILDSMVQDLVKSIKCFLSGNITEAIFTIPSWLYVAAIVGVILFLKDYLTNYDEAKEIDNIIYKWKEISVDTKSIWFSQGKHIVVDSVKKSCRFFQINSVINGNTVTEFCQGLVSGKRCILPSHVLGDNPVCKVYRDWDSYLNKEIELDDIPLKVLRWFPYYDTVVCEFDKMVIPLYKLSKAAFSNGCQFNGDLMFVNCYHELVLQSVGGYNANKNDITVRSLKGTVLFKKDSGYEYAITSQGLCGSFLTSPTQGIVAMHAAGNTDTGFAVMYPKTVRDELACLMLNQRESPFDIRPLDKEFSGTRLQHDLGTSRPIEETDYIPTRLNSDANPEMRSLKISLNVQDKKPPNFRSVDNSAFKTLQTLSEKSFMPVGTVNREELDFARQVLDSFLTDFDDIGLQEAIFGDDELERLNPDSSNGYGWKERKEDLFDFENKTISEKFVKTMNEFELECETDNLNIRHIVARETFKDELRTQKKVNIPRTFRVLPVQHIVGTKLCLGNLMKHIRKNMWTNGVAIGLNPYKDWDRLYHQLAQCEGVFDIDFGKWDGKVHPLLQDLVGDTVFARYRGKHKAMLRVILDSIVRGYVLVGDALYTTTHSLPSGTWVTALFNSLINKCLSAMCLYRAMKKDGKIPTVEDFMKLCDWAMGDDKACGAPKGYTQYFNAITMKDIATDLGMECTDGCKNPITEPFVSFSNMVFLKRNFVYDKSMDKIMCPLSVETILNSLGWYDKKKDLDVVMSGKAIAAQIEGFIHSPKFRDQLYNICKKEFPLTSYMPDERIREILNAEEGYQKVMKLLDKFTVPTSNSN